MQKSEQTNVNSDDDYDQDDENIQRDKNKNISNKLTDISLIHSSQLQSFQQIFSHQYIRLNTQLSSHVELSNFMMSKSQQLMSVLQKYDMQIQKIQLNLCTQLGKRYIISKQMREQYEEKIKKFGKTLGILFFMLEYVQKKVNYTGQTVTQPIKQPATNLSNTNSFKTCQNPPQIERGNHYLLSLPLGYSLKHKTPELLKNKINSSSLQNSKSDINSDKTIIEMSNNNNILNNNKDYISELYRIYMYLMSSDDVNDNNEDNTVIHNDEMNRSSIESVATTLGIYDSLQKNVKKWLNLIKVQLENINSSHIYHKKHDIHSFHVSNAHLNGLRNLSMYQRNPRKDKDYFHSHIMKMNNQTEQDEHLIRDQNDGNGGYYKKGNYSLSRDENIGNNNNNSNKINFNSQNSSTNINRYSQNKSFSVASSSGRRKHHNNTIIMGLLHNNTNSHPSNYIPHPNSCSKIVNIKKLRNSTDTKQAVRIRLLKDLDKDYYKMLKSTLKMQKQNTRKNYNFLRTFKRAKYSSRDQILEQKRFQCSFSMLFTGKKQPEQTNKQQMSLVSNKKSNFYKTTHVDNSRLRKSWNSNKVFDLRIKEGKQFKLHKQHKDSRMNQSSVKILKQNVKKIKMNNIKEKKLILKKIV